MFCKHPSRCLPLLLLSAMLVLSACRVLNQPARSGGIAPTPVVSLEDGGVNQPDIIIDPQAFQAALLQALVTHDTTKLRLWMTEPFLTGTWRADLAATSPAEAIESLYADQLGAENRLALVADADLNALLGGQDPLSIPRREAGVTEAFLVSGWGQDGLDEAILYLARQADNSLKWRGWLQIQGGFSGARLGGIQPYQNETYGYSLYLPKDTQIAAPVAEYVAFVPPVSEGHPGIAFVYVEPANGRTAEQAVEAVKTEQGPGFNIFVSQVLNTEKAQALIVLGIPGQDFNIQLFMVHNDLLYHMLFMPDDPQAGLAYRQMQDLYAMIINTFHFTE